MSEPTGLAGPNQVQLALARWRYEMQRQRQGEHGSAKALNAVLRAHGPPQATFGSDGVRCEVGQAFRERVELALSGLHRHFLSSCAYTREGGVESIILDGLHDVLDEGASFFLSPRPDPSAPSGTWEAIQDALATNARLERPVRTIRASQLTSSYRPESGFRYDGLYLPRRSGSRGRWAFVRLPNQHPLGRAPPAAADIDALAGLAAYCPAKRPRPSGGIEQRHQPPYTGGAAAAVARASRSSDAHAFGAGANSLGVASTAPRNQHWQVETFSLACGSATAQTELPTPSTLEGLSVAELLDVRAALLMSHDPMTVLRACTWLVLEQGRVRTAIEALHAACGAAPPMALAPWPRRTSGCGDTLLKLTQHARIL